MSRLPAAWAWLAPFWLSQLCPLSAPLPPPTHEKQVLRVGVSNGAICVVKKKTTATIPQVFPRWLSGKEPVSQCRCGFDPWVGKIPWRRKWQPTPVFYAWADPGSSSYDDVTAWLSGAEDVDSWGIPGWTVWEGVRFQNDVAIWNLRIVYSWNFPFQFLDWGWQK